MIWLAPSASLLNSEVRLYRETMQGGVPVRELIARNDDYYSNDSFLELDVEAGTYYIAVTSTGASDAVARRQAKHRLATVRLTKEYRISGVWDSLRVTRGSRGLPVVRWRP